MSCRLLLMLVIYILRTSEPEEPSDRRCSVKSVATCRMRNVWSMCISLPRADSASKKGSRRNKVGSSSLLSSDTVRCVSSASSCSVWVHFRDVDPRRRIGDCRRIGDSGSLSPCHVAGSVNARNRCELAWRRRIFSPHSHVDPSHISAFSMIQTSRASVSCLASSAVPSDQIQDESSWCFRRIAPPACSTSFRAKPSDL